MARPVAYKDMGNGTTQVTFDDGSSLLMPTNAPAIQAANPPQIATQGKSLIVPVAEKAPAVPTVQPAPEVKPSPVLAAQTNQLNVPLQVPQANVDKLGSVLVGPPPAQPVEATKNPITASLVKKALANAPPAQTRPAYGGGGGVTNIPASWQEVGGEKLIHNPEVLKAMDQLQLDKQGAAQDAYDRGVAAAQEQAAYFKEMQDQQLRQASEQARLREAQDTEKARALADIRATSDAIANQKIDPEAIWKEKGDAARVMAAIGIAAGAFAASMNGGPNYAQQIVQDAVNKNIEAQQANLENRRKGLEKQTSLYGMMLDRFKDQDMALAASKASLYEQAETKAKMWAAKAGVDANNERYNAFMNGLNEAKLQELDKIYGVIQAKYVPASRVVSGGPASSGKGAAIDAAKTVTLPDGRVIAFDTAEEAADRRKRIMAASRFRVLDEQYRAAVSNAWDPNARAAATLLAAQKKVAAAEANGLDLAQVYGRGADRAHEDLDALSGGAKPPGAIERVINWGKEAIGQKPDKAAVSDAAARGLMENAVSGGREVSRGYETNAKGERVYVAREGEEGTKFRKPMKDAGAKGVKR